MVIGQCFRVVRRRSPATDAFITSHEYLPNKELYATKGMVLLGQEFWVVRRGSPATDAFIMRHEDFPNKELYATKRMVHITEEGPEEDLFYL